VAWLHCAINKPDRYKILPGWFQDLADRQIASELSVCERTVEKHLSKILRKPGLASRAEITAWTTEQRLLAPEPD
jgi:FixJ family two-component response regulator